MASVDRGKGRPRELTGGMVLMVILAFFGLVVAVNVTMARFAVSTFAGLETESSYKAGLAFTKETNAAEAQNERRWSVDVDLKPLGGTARGIQLRVVDADGKPLSGLVADGRFAHPTDARRDVVLDLEPLGEGRYRATADAGAGQWDLVIDFTQGGERLFRSKNRVQLP
ncbi:FixH family protein [Xanthobacter sp. V4C-4]|uniref:FixH family protein n=1 Tax=Xanthobacter cornucopiae TaxID=3119924 RepID=UPI0037284246